MQDMSYEEIHETKAHGSSYMNHEVKSSLEELMMTFEDFKRSNDERLAQIEARYDADVITKDKLSRINLALDEQKSQLDRLARKNYRPNLAGNDLTYSTGQFEQKNQAFDAFMRKGVMSDLSMKALSVGSDADGGYIAPPETEKEIMRRVSEISPIRQIAMVREISASSLKKPFSTTGFSAGWVSETASRHETNTSTLAELDFPTMEIYAMPAATQTLLDDSAVDIDAWIGDEVQTAFAAQESTAFVNGNGSTQPAGFMTASFVDEASWSWGNLGQILTGTSGDFDASAPADALIDLVYTLKSTYRQNARFVMNRRTQAEIRKIKDSNGNYIWQPSAQAGGEASLFNFAITEAEDMPDIGADTTPIVFGDFRRGYLIVDRLGIRVLRDPYSSKPYVLFYTTKRVGGGIQDYDAIKGLTFSA